MPRLQLRGAIAAIALAACAPAQLSEQNDAAWAERRTAMVQRQIRARGISDPEVLAAMSRVPRHLFVPPERRHEAYEDRPLSIGLGQTISQPYIVAYMTEALKPSKTDRVLEIGTGSGYQAAVLAGLVREVYTIEIVRELADRARATLESLGMKNVNVRHGNGYLGWPDAAPFSRVIVTAAPETLPQVLVDQLAPGGILIAPVGRAEQMMTIVEKTSTGVVRRETIPVLFVPMVGKDK